MAEKKYTNREIDGMLKPILDGLTEAKTAQAAFQIEIRNSNSRIETEMSNGFKGVHDRQDIANGRTSKNEQNLAVLRAIIYTSVAIIVFLLGTVLIPIVAAYIQAGKL